MKRRFKFTLFYLFLIYVILVSSFQLVVFNKDFYHKQYAKLNTAKSIGISESDLNKATDVLLDYIIDKRPDINVLVEVEGSPTLMFNQREVDHMVDVKNIFVAVNTIKYIGIIYILIFVFSIFRESKKLNSQYIKFALKIYMIIFGALGFYALIDFNGFWTAFHQVLFTNDLWLLDPRTDRMILMFPEPFFNALVMRVLGTFIFVFAVMYVCASILERSE